MLRALIFFVIPIILMGCSASSEDIVGVWKTSEFSTNIGTVHSDVNIPAEILEETEFEAMSTVIYFHEDQTFEIKLYLNSDGGKGTWSYNNSTGMIEMYLQTIYGQQRLPDIELVSPKRMKKTEEVVDGTFFYTILTKR